MALATAGYEHICRHALSAARAPLEECLEVSRVTGDKQSLRHGLLGLGLLAYYEGGLRSAEDRLGEAVAVAEDLREDYATGDGPPIPRRGGPSERSRR